MTTKTIINFGNVSDSISGLDNFRQKKTAPKSGFKKRAGTALLSHMENHAIPSPQEDLTSEFEMGSGVAPLL